MKMWKKILIGLAAVLIVIQFFGPKRNIAQSASAAGVSSVYPVSADVQRILDKACYDCHSNNTRYPWYTNIQPVGWWMQHHVNEGSHDLNFDSFAVYSPRRQYHKLDELAEMVNEGKMPLPSYTWIHKDAILTADEKQLVLDWSKSIQTDLESKYPKDSLVMPKRKP